MLFHRVMPGLRNDPPKTGRYNDLSDWPSARYTIRIVLIHTPSGPAKLFKIIPDDFVVQNPHEPTDIH
jgi:hypothetical protein